MEDSRIIALYWERSTDAIVESREKYGRYCFAVAHRILEDYGDSEECVNDTWLNAWNAMPPHRPDVLRMFFAKITRRIAFDRYKHLSAQKRGRGEVPQALDELAECIGVETDMDGGLIAQELAECVRTFLRSLPEREGDLFLRRYFFTESVGEIGKSYGMTSNHVAVLLGRVRKKLKEHLIEEGFCDE